MGVLSGSEGRRQWPELAGGSGSDGEIQRERDRQERYVFFFFFLRIRQGRYVTEREREVSLVCRMAISRRVADFFP